jgi:hypothetical protein
MAYTSSLKLSLFATSILFAIFSSLHSQTRNLESENNEIEIMDPETMYSFSGIEGQGFLNRSPVNLPVPAYDGDETGIVGLMFTINPNGKVSRVKQETFALTTANAEMVQAAKNAVLQWEFAPLKPGIAWEDQDVRVIIQYNHSKSGVMYSIDGLYQIEGLVDRLPIELKAPDYNTSHEGIVTVVLAISPEGTVSYINKSYGAYTYQKVIPRLGIITYEAVRKWRFDALTPEQKQEDQEITVKIRYQHLK